jgi:hypothetical protein
MVLILQILIMIVVGDVMLAVHVMDILCHGIMLMVDVILYVGMGLCWLGSNAMMAIL